MIEEAAAEIDVPIGDATDTFITRQLRHCEVFHDVFLNHFRKRGFAVHAPRERLMIAVFDSPAGFEAYLGQKMSSGITGIYHTPTNRLVLYDLARNRQLVAATDAEPQPNDSVGGSSPRTPRS